MLFVLRKFLHHTYRPLLQWYLRKPRAYRRGGMSIEVEPGVFHPGLFKSTEVLLEYLEQVDLRGKKLLELGCGSGLISIWAARQGAEVTASDISQKAVTNTRCNAVRNDVKVDAIYSDLFEHIPPQPFDFIIINPPFYASDPATEEQQAWYCGANHGYFARLFQQLKQRQQASTQVLMVLSSDCELPVIQNISTQNELTMNEVYRKKFLFEEDIIYLVT